MIRTSSTEIGTIRHGLFPLQNGSPATWSALLTTTVLWPGARRLGPALLVGLAVAFPATPQATDDHTSVRLGVEVLLEDSLGLVQGRRVGLITNHTGRDRSGRATIDLLARHPDIDLVALYSPEHGIRGSEGAGIKVADEIDARTGLPVHSLYGDTRAPTDETLAGVEVLLFDIQDIGTRYYTYLSTMALAMAAAGEQGIPFVILDRPNPIGGHLTQGSILDPRFASFVGLYPIPMRHGLTAGEFARLAVGEFGVRVQLSVAVAAGWTRAMPFGDTGVPWVAPSPNMPTLESALHYPGTCLFEGTSISVGRGTPRAFQQVGAPWLDAVALADRMARLNLPGVRFVPATFTPLDPGDGKFADTLIQGVRLVATAPDYDPTKAALALLVETKAMSGEHWSWREGHFDRLAGTDALRRAIDGGATLAEMSAHWDEPLSRYRALRRPYLLYP